MWANLRSVLLPSAPGALRLWLALVVVIHHVTRLEIGKAPVLVFFALSGYWVHRVWTARYQATRWPWLTFLVSRWWRVAPIMVLSAGLSIAAMAVTEDDLLAAAGAVPWRQAFSSVFVLGYAQMPVRPVGPAWSLDIEMQFYVLAPLLVALVRRTGAILALFLAYLVYVIGLALYPELVLTSFLVPFVIGMVAAQHNWTVSPRLAEAGQGAAIVLVAAAWLSPARALLLGSGEGGLWPEFNILLAALVLPQALVSVQSVGGPHDRLWADQSYVVYMVHWPAILLLRGLAWSGAVDWAVGLTGLAVGTMALCWMVHRWIDRPLNRARGRWVAERVRTKVRPADPHLQLSTKGDDSAAAIA